jgi:threonine synthase
MFDNKFIDLKRVVESVSVSDETTAATMRQVHDTSGYVLDPHGAVGYRALADHISTDENAAGFFLETAHPVKFDSVNEILGETGEMPEAVSRLFSLQKRSTEMNVNYSDLRDVLLAKL